MDGLESMGGDPETPRRGLLPLPLHTYLAGACTGVLDIPSPVHSTPAAKLLDLVAGGEIKTTRCDVFTDRELCYTFLGRPAYKWSTKGEASWWQCPVVFVLRGLSDLSVREIFPFDTGAFKSGRFPDYVTDLNLLHFSMGTDLKNASCLISLLFETEGNYFSGQFSAKKRFLDEISSSPTLMYVQALARLYAEKPSQSSFDDRNRTIEVQVDQSIPICKKMILGIIMPESFFGLKELSDFLDSQHITRSYYSLFPLSTEAYYSEIYRLVMEMSGATKKNG